MTAHPIMGKSEHGSQFEQGRGPLPGPPVRTVRTVRHAYRGMPMAATTAAGSAGRARTRSDGDGAILRSKITVPGLPDWAVPRPPLDRPLAHRVPGPLTAPMGPPGTRQTPAPAPLAAPHPPPRPAALRP